MMDEASPAAPFDEPTLAQELAAEPYRFEFFAALRVLARLTEEGTIAADNSLASQAALRFRAYQSLAFPASEIVSIDPAKSDPRVKEIAVTREGMRIIRQADEGRRGDYLLLRQAVFDNASVSAEDLDAVLREIDALRASILTPSRELQRA